MTDVFKSNESKTSVLHDLQSVQSNLRCTVCTIESKMSTTVVPVNRMTPPDSKDGISTMKLQYRQQSAMIERTYPVADAEGVDLVSFECGTLLRMAGASWNQFYETCQPGPSQPQIS